MDVFILYSILSLGSLQMSYSGEMSKRLREGRLMAQLSGVPNGVEVAAHAAYEEAAILNLC